MQKQFLAAVVASVVAGQAMAATVFEDDNTKFSIGGHVGMRYGYESGQADQSDLTAMGDSSRFNFQFESKLNENVTAFARGEWGFDVTKHGGDFAFSNRLGFAGIKGDFGSISVGQQWSTYSTVAAWTDSFATAGGDGTAMYSSWGDYNGTARANEALQYNLSVDGLNISAQFQAGGSAKEVEVSVTKTRDRAYSMAASYDLPMGLSIGGAYNQTKFVQSAHKDAKALVLAAKFEQGPIYAAASFSESKNHATFDGNTFEKAHGYELFTSYQLNENFSSVGGGFNTLRDKAGISWTTPSWNTTQSKLYTLLVQYSCPVLTLSKTAVVAVKA